MRSDRFIHAIVRLAELADDGPKIARAFGFSLYHIDLQLELLFVGTSAWGSFYVLTFCRTHPAVTIASGVCGYKS